MDRSWLPPMGRPDNQVRLLELPPSWKHGDLIELTLRTYDLQATPNFQAISYTWGPALSKFWLSSLERSSQDVTNISPRPSSSLRVICNHTEVCVGQNLLEALEDITLRYPGTLLWNDALCIDQLNEEEKNDQILLMARIYQQAQNVIIYLGKDTPYTAQSYALYEAFSSVPDHEWQQRQPAKNKLIWWKALQASSTDVPDQILAVGTGDLANRQWWTRKWTYQESVLSSKSVVLCGSYMFDFKRLQDMIVNLKEVEFGQHQGGAWTTRFVGELNKYMLDMHTAQHQTLIISENQTRVFLHSQVRDHNYAAILLFYLAVTASRQAFSAPDTFRSVFGCCEAVAQRLNQDIPDMRYLSKLVGNTEQYTAEATKMIISGYKTLVPLHFIRWRTSSIWRPSWAIWDQNNFHPDGILGEQFHADPSETSDSQHTASFRQERSSIETSIVLDVLRVQGIVVGSVTSVNVIQEKHVTDQGDVVARAYKDWQRLISVLSFFDALPEAFWSESQSYGDLRHALAFNKTQTEVHVWLSLIAETFLRYQVAYLADKSKQGGQAETPSKDIHSEMNGLRARPIMKQLLSADKTDWQGFTSRINTLLSSFQALKQPEGTSGARPHDTRIAEYEYSLDRMLGTAEFSLLYIGPDLVGSTSAMCRAGDEVWILKGAEQPLILRHALQPGYFELIGSAYVDSAMYGQFFSQSGRACEWKEVNIV